MKKILTAMALMFFVTQSVQASTYKCHKAYYDYEKYSESDPASTKLAQFGVLPFIGMWIFPVLIPVTVAAAGGAVFFGVRENSRLETKRYLDAAFIGLEQITEEVNAANYIGWLQNHKKNLAQENQRRADLFLPPLTINEYLATQPAYKPITADMIYDPLNDLAKNISSKMGREVTREDMERIIKSEADTDYFCPVKRSGANKVLSKRKIRALIIAKLNTE